MTEPTVAPYGTWNSPLTAAAVAAASHTPTAAAYVGDQIWWSEPVPAERRVGVFRIGADGEPEPVLPAPWNARSQVHEYGGGEWCAGDDGVLAFVEFHSQRLYRLDQPGGTPMPLTPENAATHFGGLVRVGDAVLAVRETMTGERPTDVVRDLVLVPLDGRAADDAQPVTSVVGGSRFLAQPAISPDGSQLAWIAWDHPNMPWDGTELRVGDLTDGRVTEWRTVLGGTAESVLQPEWTADGALLALTDRTGWWNLVRVPLVGGGPEREPEPLAPGERETGGPLWVLDTRWYLPLPDGRIALTATLGSDEQQLLRPDSSGGPGTGERVRLAVGRSRTEWQAARGDRVLVIDEAAGEPGALHELDLAAGTRRVVRAGADALPDAIVPAPAERDFDGVHAVVYPPRNADFTPPAGELPPYVVFVHGGPTSHTGPMQSRAIVYYTSRGIGVVDVNYGGSTGYGRPYRNRLRGQWGVVDIDDVVTVVRGLAQAGLADPARLAIEGGSAGGWTVLSALTNSDVFACGASRYGVADLVALLQGTHDFESQYLQGLVGPYPQRADLYAERAPINHVDRIDCPVLLLQGLDDKVVPPAQSQMFRDALAARHIPHAYLQFAGEGHGFRGRETIIAAREATLSFYGQVLGFEPPGVPVLPLAS
ncbi:S9 family peptidase [uncultured Amnibacterium sp.]|uniref:S9 family peptidase n=1 Tax=uncultured Amnibacterium sp. TaxID=1631851 RepID=UPI0035C9FFC6